MLLHGNLCPNAPYHILQHMSRDRPTNSDLKMCVIARQDFETERASKKTQFLCVESSVVVLWELSLVGQTLPLHLTLVLAEPEGQTWLTHLHHSSFCWLGSKPDLAGLSTMHNITEPWNILSWEGPIRTVESISWPCTGQPMNHTIIILYFHLFSHIALFAFSTLSAASFSHSLPRNCPGTVENAVAILLWSMARGLELKGSPPSPSDRFPGQPVLCPPWFPAHVPRQQCHHPLLSHSCPRAEHHLEGNQA